MSTYPDPRPVRLTAPIARRTEGCHTCAHCPDVRAYQGHRLPARSMYACDLLPASREMPTGQWRGVLDWLEGWAERCTSWRQG